MSFFGYMTEREAKGHGFTHHGKYFGIPIWISPSGEAPMVATKWAPMEHVMTLFHVVEGLVAALFYPDVEPCFQFAVGEKIA